MLAYWVDPNNRFSEITDNHIISIITNPEAFGTSKKVIEDTYLKFNERVGAEGKARRELIDAAIEQGWIRIRLYPKTHCSITIAEVNVRVLHTATEFITMLISGRLDVEGVDKFMPVVFTTIKSGDTVTDYTMKEISDGILLQGDNLVTSLEYFKSF